MRLFTLRFHALMLAALTSGMGLCHLMELPARMAWDQELWVSTTVTGGLYWTFGTFGAVVVVANIIVAVVLAYRVRGRSQTVFRATAFAAAAFVLALASWFAFVFPMNMELATWLTGPIPDNWADIRRQWEITHGFNALIQFVGLGALVLSVLLETPAEEEAPAASRERGRDPRHAHGHGKT